MDDTEVELILARFEDLKDHIDSKVDTLDRNIGNRITALEEDAATICTRCKNSITFKEKFKNQWVNIGAIWACISVIFALLWELRKR